MNWLNQVIGQGIASNIGACGQMASNHQQAQQQAIQQYQAQQAYNVGAQGMSQGSLQGISRPMRWMFDGVMVEFKDFVELMFPEDCPQKTMFVLKYSKGENE